MRTLHTFLFLTLLGTSTIHAQSQGAVDKAAADPHSCMLMSDSLAIALGVTGERRELVRQSDMQCIQACEKVGYRTTGAMDEMAMRTHEADMREILTERQFERWSHLCARPEPKKNAAEESWEEAEPE